MVPDATSDSLPERLSRCVRASLGRGTPCVCTDVYGFSVDSLVFWQNSTSAAAPQTFRRSCRVPEMLAVCAGITRSSECNCCLLPSWKGLYWRSWLRLDGFLVPHDEEVLPCPNGRTKTSHRPSVAHRSHLVSLRRCGKFSETTRFDAIVGFGV